MTEDSSFFCFFFLFFPWVSALITGLLLALPHLYKRLPQSLLLLWTMASPPPPKKSTLSLLLLGRVAFCSIFTFQIFTSSIFFSISDMSCIIIHARYHVSLTVPGIDTLIYNILIAAWSYILLSLQKKGMMMRQ